MDYSKPSWWSSQVNHHSGKFVIRNEMFKNKIN